MSSDIWTVLQKEWKELLLLRGGFRGNLTQLLLGLGVFGVFVPWQFRAMWLTSPFTLMWVAFVAVFWTTAVVADSFAGERERHTLETLLASRLCDRAILLGKYLAVLGYVCGQLFAVLLLGAVTVNLSSRGAGLAFYRATVGLGAAGVGLLGAGLVAALGVLVSLRAATVRQAQQRLLIPLAIPLVLPGVCVQVLSAERKAQVVQWLAGTGSTGLVLAVGLAALLVADVVLLAVASTRFKRARLVLD